MKSSFFLLITGVLTAVFFLFSPQQKSTGIETYAEKEGELLLPQKNVAIAVLQLSDAGLSFIDPEHIIRMRVLQDDFISMKGVTKIESILNVSRVISEGDDIVVSRAIPAENLLVTEAYLKNLSKEIPEFPELSPYISSDLGTALFYIYFSNNTDPRGIHQDLKNLQQKWKDEMPFDFTGRAPIIAETESLLTKDIVLFIPILFLMAILIFSLFRNLKAVLVSMFLIVLSIVFAYGFLRFLGIQDSPLILLIPVFCIGLLSDYFIHYFYHRFHTPISDGHKSLRKLLIFPLSLTALSTITGFLSLSLINGSGHLQLGGIMAVAVVFTWTAVFFWIDYLEFPAQQKQMFSGFQRAQGRLFVQIAKYRFIFFLVIIAGILWGGSQLFNLSIEPYPIQQLPEKNTIKKADRVINDDFFGTLPFFIEVDTGETNGLLKKDTLLKLNEIHQEFDDNNVGYAFSLLTVLKRMNYYFMGSEESFLSSTEFDDIFDALNEQYLLYYSSSVDPLEYESLLDNSYRYFSIKGLLYYQNHEDLNRFISLLEGIEKRLPEGWSLSNYGMAAQLVVEQTHLRNNWVLSFLSGSLLIFMTVLIYYRKLGLAVLSLLPGVVSMIISFGLISIAGISIDAFSIIFVAIITGLVIDYSIHTLIALDQIKEVETLSQGFRRVIGYSGIPIFLSFTTSVLSFSVLFLSSFSGARILGFLLLSSLVLSFIMSLYLIPLIILPLRLKKESINA
ncbi:hypothetical protein [Oceanispirochaeta sp.]|jgi:predicted RND superfamily exporter protein|uniref:efflux RND transporter permease subunit n=1 Tax=Oceanispirochaeta sp. TaxID=2035350 RepID=UPI0026111353|nr:hypothetical protein [Oceanispirochaeta sp.]MDA3958675.1 hypothetical protein [Oceanispirochaeta sp.]